MRHETLFWDGLIGLLEDRRARSLLIEVVGPDPAAVEGMVSEGWGYEFAVLVVG